MTNKTMDDFSSSLFFETNSLDTSNYTHFSTDNSNFVFHASPFDTKLPNWAPSSSIYPNTIQRSNFTIRRSNNNIFRSINYLCDFMLHYMILIYTCFFIQIKNM